MIRNDEKEGSQGKTSGGHASPDRGAIRGSGSAPAESEAPSQAGQKEGAMTNAEMIANIGRWQGGALLVHPLTCGVDSHHRTLVPREKDGRVVLACLDCDYLQADIPAVVLGSTRSGL
jgi:hypothetical protein